VTEESERHQGATYPGKYKAFVRRNDDPENRGRLRCYCPQVMGSPDDETRWLGWAEPCFPWIGGINTLDFGSPYTKQQNGGVEVGVWLEFEGGNPDFPVWVGTWLPAPVATDPNAQLDLLAAAGNSGGSLLDHAPAGSNLAALNPPAPIVGEQETRLMTKEGRDLVLGCKGGGYVILGPSGVHFVGVQVTSNGRLFDASSSQVVG
jgi:hypothetical protein